MLSSGRSADYYADQPPPAAGGGTVGEKRADRHSEPGRPGTTKAYYVYVFFLRLSVRLSSVSLLCALLVFFFGGFFTLFSLSASIRLIRRRDLPAMLLDVRASPSGKGPYLQRPVAG